jgi:uncharacterized protein
VSRPPSAALAADHLWGFLGALARSGVPGTVPQRADFLRAVGEDPPDDVTDLYWYARVTLLRSVTDVPVFDRVFDAWFRGGPEPPAATPPPDAEGATEAPRGPGADELPQSGALQGQGVAASELHTVGRRDVDAGDRDRRALMRTLEGAWADALPRVRSRRRRPARAGDRLDTRRILRLAGRHGGEITELRRRARPARRRRLVVLLDVSGSLRTHTPDLLRLAHTAVRSAPGRTEAFTFGTRLTRVTAELSARHPDRALRGVADRVVDVDGGTAIGAALGEFLGNSRYVSLARGALVVVVSDGLERGDCTAMVRATERLSRLGFRLLWWSPLACSATYRPVTRGMAGQLRHLDHLGGVGDLSSGLAEVRRIPAV